MGYLTYNLIDQIEVNNNAKLIYDTCISQIDFFIIHSIYFINRNNGEHSARYSQQLIIG